MALHVNPFGRTTPSGPGGPSLARRPNAGAAVRDGSTELSVTDPPSCGSGARHPRKGTEPNRPPGVSDANPCAFMTNVHGFPPQGWSRYSSAETSQRLIENRKNLGD
jgi:hypothetical protein